MTIPCGLLLIDSPQQNLGSDVWDGDAAFADEGLVPRFYRHAKRWLVGPGAGAQLVVFDKEPPESVAADVVVRYTRDRNIPPYGPNDDAID